MTDHPKSVEIGTHASVGYPSTVPFADVAGSKKLDLTPSAWRCEGPCRKLVPMGQPSFLVLIEEAGPLRRGAGPVAAKARFWQRLVVCEPCRRTITGS